MHERNWSGIDASVLVGSHAQQMKEMRAAAQMQLFAEVHMEIMRTVYLKLVSEQVKADGEWIGTVTSEAMDSYAREARRAADRFMIANGFMKEPEQQS